MQPADIRSNSFIDFSEIAQLADQGVVFVGTSIGKTYSDWAGWPDRGTDNKDVLRQWLENGFSLVSLAKHGHQFMIDVDDPAGCKAMGMPDPFLGPTYTVDSPSGGEHQYGLHDAVTETLGNLVTVYAEPGNTKSKKILELKLNGANTVAAPTAKRVGQPKKCDGVYRPRQQKQLARGLNPAFIEWLSEIGEFTGAPKTELLRSGTARKFHPSFDREDFLEHHHAAEARSYRKNGALHVVSNTCPLNGAPHRDGDETRHVKDRCTVFIFGRDGIGFSCVVCNIFTWAEFTERMSDAYGDFEPYPHYIYADDDINLLFSDPKLPIEIIQPDPKPLPLFLIDDPVPPQANVMGATAAAAMAKEAVEAGALPTVKTKSGEFRFYTEELEEDDITVVAIRMSSITTDKLQWLWQNKIPSGNVTLFGGQPGCGKTIVLLDLVARTTTGADWPDGSKNAHGPKDVILLASEDGEADTIKPRLIAAGADMNRVIVIRRMLYEKKDKSSKYKRQFQLDVDILVLKRALKQHPDVALVALDPISAFFGACEPNKDKEIRPVMEGIADAMDGTKCAFIGIIHNNKRGDADSISKILGASSVVGVARAVWGFGYDADDKTLRHMLLVKGNLSEKRTGMSYKLKNTVVQLDNGEDDHQPMVDWQGETDDDADDMLAKRREKAKNPEDTKVTIARAMLIESLENGPRKVADLHRIREKEGISESTMKRARYELNLQCSKTAPWYWAMPGTPLPGSKSNDGEIGDVEVL
jgi:putative DNA primase/helicase